MNHTDNLEEILSQAVPGYHCYTLTEPVHLTFASQDLCALTGYTPEELCCETEDLYAALVHPADRDSYRESLRQLSRSPQKRTLQYRIVKKDGTLCHVSDAFTTRQQPDGTMAGYSVLTDITQLKKETNDLQFLSQTIPCGFLKYNEQMRAFLRFPGNDPSQWEFCRDNIYLLIPMEERRRFSEYLNRVYTEGGPIAGEITILRADGTKARLFGWVTKSVNEQGEEEFQSACMDITQRHLQQKEREARRYVTALTEVYDKIFEYDLSAGTVKCLHGQSSPVFRWIENIPMQMEEATEKWILANACEQDRERLARGHRQRRI